MWLKSHRSFHCFRIFLVIPVTVTWKQFHVQNHKGALRVLSWFTQGFSVWGCSWIQRGFLKYWNTDILPVCSNKHMCTSEWAQNITQCLSHMSSSTQAHKTHKHTYFVSVSISTIVLTWDVQLLQSSSSQGSLWELCHSKGYLYL